MPKSKSTEINILFLGMLFCNLVLPYFLVSVIENATYYTQLLLAQVLLQLPVVVYLSFTQTNPCKLISFKPFSPLAALLIILMTYCVLPLASLANLISMLFVDNALTDVTYAVYDNSLGLNLLFIAIIPALSEEFAFRGVIFHTLKKHGLWFGVLASALFFGMMHLNFNQFSYTVIIGIVMALAVLATGSIWGSVLVHFTLNANSVILMKVLENFTDVLGSMQTETVDTALETTYATGELIILIGIIGIVALIMLIPAGCFLYTIAHICRKKDVLGSMFFPKKYPRPEADSGQIHEGTQDRETLCPQDENADGARKRRILDVFFVLDLIVAFGYMIATAF